MQHSDEVRQRIEANKKEAARRLAATRERQNRALNAQRNAAPVTQNGSRSLDSFPAGPRNGQNNNIPNGGVHTPNPFDNYPVRGPSDPARPNLAPNSHSSTNPFAPRASSFPVRNPAPVSAGFNPVLGDPSRLKPMYVSLPQPPTGPQSKPVIPPKAPANRIIVKASLLPKGRFLVSSPYSVQLTELCKRFKTRNYNPKDRAWSFHLSDYSSFEKAVQGELKAYVIWEGLPKFIQEAFVKGKFADKTDGVDLSEKIPPALLNALLPYQVVGVRFAVSNAGRVLIADDMGLGKTIQAIATAQYFQEFPVLCVAPSSMRFEWKEQWLRWCPQLKNCDVLVVTSRNQIDSSTSAKIIISTYDLLSGVQKDLMQIGVPTVICDESHSLKTYKAARTKAAMEICKSAKHILLLSGTPALSRPQELYSQLEIIDKQLFKSFPEFGRRYCNGHMSNRGFMDYSGKSNTEELQVRIPVVFTSISMLVSDMIVAYMQLMLESTVMIRRLKKDVANQLREKSRKVVLLDPDIVQFDTKELTESQEHFRRQTSSKTASHHEKRGSLLNYYQQTGKAKVPAVIQYLQQLMEGNETLKVVIFAHHNYVLSQLYGALSETYRGIRIDGSTAPEDRKVLCDTFQQDDNCRIAVLSITACSTGL
ncbi:hypothetical protein RvY_09464, partial [Ramazzottius varieornatus]